jgi:hypothetical protein
MDTVKLRYDELTSLTENFNQSIGMPIKAQSSVDFAQNLDKADPQQLEGFFEIYEFFQPLLMRDDPEDKLSAALSSLENLLMQ